MRAKKCEELPAETQCLQFLFSAHFFPNVIWSILGKGFEGVENGSISGAAANVAVQNVLNICRLQIVRLLGSFQAGNK